MRIVTGLLHANYKENLMTRFSANKWNRFSRPVYFYSCCHGNGTYVSLTIKKPKLVLLTSLLPFLVTVRSRVLEKKVNETQVSKTVFSHLNIIRSFACICWNNVVSWHIYSQTSFMDRSSWDSRLKKPVLLNAWDFRSPIFTFRPPLPFSML